MICGIYKLTFPNGETYIGQSLDIAKRFEDHKTNLLRGRAAAKMQTAFRSGMPSVEVVIECHRDCLNLLEGYYILKEKATLNTTVPFKSISALDCRIIERNLPVFKLGILDLITKADSLYDQLEVEKTQLDVLEYEVINIQNELVKLTNMTTDERLLAALKDTEELKKTYDDILENKNQTIEALTSMISAVPVPWYKKLMFWN